jgi:hypothetical protein
MSNKPHLIMEDLEAHLTKSWTRGPVRLTPKKKEFLKKSVRDRLFPVHTSESKYSHQDHERKKTNHWRDSGQAGCGSAD